VKEISMTQRILIFLGVGLVIIGLLWPYLTKLGLGKLPGDIVIRRDNFNFYFPITTCILISVVLTGLFWLAGKLK
jgi:formate hydrogenlyase subunit 3/multisubunit Na+/H+ antiporter MnhD subunit